MILKFLKEIPPRVTLYFNAVVQVLSNLKVKDTYFIQNV